MRATARENSCGAKQRALGFFSKKGMVTFFIFVLCVALSLLYISPAQWIGSDGQMMQSSYNEQYEVYQSEKNDYAIRNFGGCSIPDFDPFDKSYRRVFFRVSKPTCTSTPPVSYIRTLPGTTDRELIIDTDIIRKKYTPSAHYTCCYSEVHRHPKKKDQEIQKSKCHPIKNKVALSNTTEFLIVSCQNSAMGKRKPKVWYKNAHALVPDKEPVQRRLAESRSAQTNSPVSVLLVGIDSISRLNFMRSMPKTARYLYDNDWIELRGYNKIGDNTYPNAMAILTGMSPVDAYSICKPTTRHGLENCTFVWNNFTSKGYVTAYGEDLPHINTFNYKKSGFYNQPTDYYMRPYFLAMQSHMPPHGSSNRYFCTGPMPAAERIYNYALDYTIKFRDDPSFALFWLNSFSHDDVNLPTAMDGVTLNFLNNLQKGGILDSSVIFFFSDHGIRFGKSRELFTGFYEERLPFFFAWFPTWFRDRYPNLVEAFNTNSNRLTTPYDFHVTLRHLLSLSDDPEVVVQNGTDGCPNSTSLLNKISSARNCEDACIDPHWCTCGELVEYDPSGNISMDMAKAAIDYLNNVELVNQTYCAHLVLRRVLKLRTLQDSKPHWNQYVVDFETSPGNARFEATVTKDNKNNFIVHDQISRLNTYQGQSNCVSNDSLRKYCFCLK